MKLYLLGLLVFALYSCSSSKVNPVQETPLIIDAKTVWSVLNHSAIDSWSSAELIKVIGKPSEIEPAKKGSQTWIYYHKRTDSQEWAFEMDGADRISAVVYLPSSDKFEDFTLDNIKKNWKSFNCENREKQIIYPDFIKDVTYLSCDKEKRTVEFNRYGEVRSITVIK